MSGPANGRVYGGTVDRLHSPMQGSRKAGTCSELSGLEARKERSFHREQGGLEAPRHARLGPHLAGLRALEAPQTGAEWRPMKKLTRNQRLVLAAAAGRDHLGIDPVPDELGAAATNIVDVLLASGLLVPGNAGPLITMTGFDALGAEPNSAQLTILDRIRAEPSAGPGNLEPKEPVAEKA